MEITPATYENMPTEHSQVDFDIGEKELIQTCEKDAKNAITVAQTQYWSAIDSVKSIYGTFELAPTTIQAANSKDFELKVNDVADQVDEMFAIGKGLAHGREKRRMVPIRTGNKTDAKQVSMTQKAQDALLRERDIDNEISLSWMRYIKYNFAGFKVCRHRRETVKNERTEIPATGLTIPELLRQGYSMDQCESGFAVRHACSRMGLRFQGYADEQQHPDSNGFPVFTKVMCIKTSRSWEDDVYIKSIDPRKFAVADINRPISKQPAVHEFEYLTLDDVRQAYPYNADTFKQKATAVPDNSQEPGGTPVGNSTSATGVKDSPLFEVTLTWKQIDFQEMINSGRITEKTIMSLSDRFCIPYDEFFIPGKWCIVHWKDQCMLDLYPNYLWERSDYPQDVESYIFQEERFCDKGMVHRISSPCAGLHKVRNLVYKNIKRMLNQSRIVSRRLGITDDDLEQLEEENGNVWANGQAIDLASDIQFVMPPDVSGPGFGLMGSLDANKQQLGVSNTMSGNDQSDTATQAQINQNRGQVIANEAFGRFIGMLMRSYKKHLGAMIATITRGRMIRAVGEDGTTFEETWITPSDLTDRVEIIPMVSFNDTKDQQKAQFLLGLTNVFAPFSQPQEIIATKNLIMKLGGVTKDELDEIQGKIGTYTNVAQEIEAMLVDSSIAPEVIMSDPHELCIAVATAALQGKIDEYVRMGITQPDVTRFGNIMTYIQAHQAMLAQMQLAAKLMTPPPTKGKPKNEDSAKEKESSRESGQEASPKDSGTKTNSGFTGAGSPPPNTI